MISNFLFIAMFLNCCVLIYLALSVYFLTKKIDSLEKEIKELKPSNSKNSKIKLFEKD